MSTTPERRVDKNGVSSIKHVRAAPKETRKRTALPAPKLPSARQSGKSKGSADYYPNISNKVHPTIAALQKGKTTPVMRLTDDLVYDLCSVVRPVDAIALASIGIKNKEEALALLRKHGITELAVDRSDLMDAAAEAGLPANAFSEFVRKHEPEGCDKQNYIDGASLHHLKGAREAQLDLEVAAGTIRLSDLKSVGVTRVTASTDRRAVLKAMESIKSGAVPYDAKELKTLLEKPTRHVGRSLDLAGKFGTDFVLGLESVLDTWKTHLHLEKIGYDMSHEKEVLAYGNALWTSLSARSNEVYSARKNPLRFEDIPVLYESGISAEEVAAEMSEGFDVNQVIARLKHGVHTSLSDGFL
jgi:hypothetical protein